MAITYILGHVVFYFVIGFIYRHGLVYLWPVVYSLIPIIGISLGFKGKVYRKTSEYPRVTILMTVIFVGTWTWLMWAYFKV